MTDYKCGIHPNETLVNHRYYDGHRMENDWQCPRCREPERVDTIHNGWFRGDPRDCCPANTRLVLVHGGIARTATIYFNEAIALDDGTSLFDPESGGHVDHVPKGKEHWPEMWAWAVLPE